MITFPDTPSNDATTSDPIYTSACGRWRIVELDCIRPFRLFRRIKSLGWPWIGVDSGFDTRAAAITRANEPRAKRDKITRTP